MIKCDKNQIIKEGYTYYKKSSKKAIKVNPTCIDDKGKPGKGLPLIKIPEYDIGLLSEYGYKLSNSYEKRILALKKAIIYNSKLKILRHINALKTLQKSNEKIYNKLSKDLLWIQNEYKKN